MLKYTINVLSELKKAGYTQQKLVHEYHVGHKTLAALRQGNPISWRTIELICELLRCQPDDFIQWIPDESNINES